MLARHVYPGNRKISASGAYQRFEVEIFAVAAGMAALHRLPAVWTIGALANVPDTLGRRRKPVKLTVIDGGKS